MNTASANYRPGNTNTNLRKPGKKSSKGKTKSSKKPPVAESSSKQMDPGDDSFHISPDKKYPTSKKGGDEILSGASEFDNLGEKTSEKFEYTDKGNKIDEDRESEEGEDDHLKKSLEKEFEEAAEKYPEELENRPKVRNRPDRL